jgi:hypothetical protein
LICIKNVQADAGLGDLAPALKKLSLPVAVIHGQEDWLLKVEAGFEIGQLVPGTELHIYPGMGHEFPRLLARPAVTVLIDAAIARAPTPFVHSGRGPVVIRSRISPSAMGFDR